MVERWVADGNVVRDTWEEYAGYFLEDDDPQEHVARKNAEYPKFVWNGGALPLDRIISDD